MFAQPLIYQFSADLYVVGFRISLAAEFGYDLAINGHLTCTDHFLGSSPRGDTGLGDKFLKSFGHWINNTDSP